MGTLTEQLMEEIEVQRFFPQNLAALLEFPETKMKYFGISTFKIREQDKEDQEKIVNHDFYLAAVLDNLFLYETHQKELNFRKSKNRWIFAEGIEYDALANRKYYDQLHGYSPLLVLRIHNWRQPVVNHFQFAELLRYADHEEFRKRGIAAAVLDSVSSALVNAYATRFVYVNYGWCSWPKKSQVIPACFSSDSFRESVMDCFVPHERTSFRETFLQDRNGFFRMTNPALHEQEYTVAMKKREEWRQYLDAEK